LRFLQIASLYQGVVGSIPPDESCKPGQKWDSGYVGGCSVLRSRWQGNEVDEGRHLFLIKPRTD
uniref:ENR1 protein n=1 Tax=Hydatigena taeniaeformis TaxID=6205 RepID=A0A0R3X2I7_HYDTA